MAMVGLLSALPNTQLTRRLVSEHRLYEGHDFHPDGRGDQCVQGLNFETLRPRQEIFDDYRQVLERIYDPAAYCGRVERLIGRLKWTGKFSRSMRRTISLGVTGSNRCAGSSASFLSGEICCGPPSCAAIRPIRPPSGKRSHCLHFSSILDLTRARPSPRRNELSLRLMKESTHLRRAFQHSRNRSRRRPTRQERRTRALQLAEFRSRRARELAPTRTAALHS